MAFPDSTEEVSALVAICAEEGCPVIPWGVGSSLEGHAIPYRGGLTIDTSRMNKVLEVHDGDRGWHGPPVSCRRPRGSPGSPPRRKSPPAR
ncbi:MAG: FAD-binding protein, partial [Pseudomonadota bacterium]